MSSLLVFACVCIADVAWGSDTRVMYYEVWKSGRGGSETDEGREAMVLLAARDLTCPASVTALTVSNTCV